MISARQNNEENNKTLYETMDELELSSFLKKKCKSGQADA